MRGTLHAVLVDDHQIVIEGLKIVFSSIPYLKIEESFNNGKDLLHYDNLKEIDIVFLDVFLPDSNGIDLCLNLKRLYPSIKVIALSSQAERGIILQLIKNGADGYLLKSASIKDFMQSVEGVKRGKIVFCREVQKLIDKININDIKKLPTLTKREKDVLSLLKKGKSSQEISEALFLSYLTVQTHRRNLLHKFNVSNVVELLNVISEHGIII